MGKSWRIRLTSKAPPAVGAGMGSSGTSPPGGSLQSLLRSAVSSASPGSSTEGPAGHPKPLAPPRPAPPRPFDRPKLVGQPSGVLIFMVFVRLHAFQNAQCVFRQNSERTIQRDQVRRDCLRIDTHEAHRKARRLLSRKIRLEQSNHALFAFAGANQQDVCLAVFESQLV